MAEIPSKSIDDGYLVYPKERLISDLDRETRGGEKKQKRSAAAQNTPPHLVRPENMLTSRRDPLLATTWNEIENRTETKPAEDTKREPGGAIETKSKETIQEPERKPSRKSSRRLSDYRDSEEILEMLRERRESKLKRLSLLKEKRLSEHREEEECIGKAKTKQERRASKQAEKERKELEKRNSRRNSTESKNGENSKKPRRLSEYRDYDEMIAVNKSSAKAQERGWRGRSSSRPSTVVESQEHDTTNAIDVGPKDASTKNQTELKN